MPWTTSVSRIHESTDSYNCHAVLINVTMSKVSITVSHESVVSKSCVNSGKSFDSSKRVRGREICFNYPLSGNGLYSLLLSFRCLDGVHPALAQQMIIFRQYILGVTIIVNFSVIVICRYNLWMSHKFLPIIQNPLFLVTPIRNTWQCIFLCCVFPCQAATMFHWRVHENMRLSIIHRKIKPTTSHTNYEC
jgi:hypothetical protein